MLDPTIVVAAITSVTGVVGVLGSRRIGTGKDRREAQRTLEAKCRALEDALNTARTALRDGGLPVPPWPRELTDMRENGEK